MPNSAKILLFVLLFPFFAAVGHDVYINYFSTPEKQKQIERLQFNFDEFMISDTGWVWNEYAKDSMEIARGSIEPEQWTAQIDPILQLPTMVVGLIPFAIGVIFLVISFVLGVGMFKRQGKRRKENADDFAVYKHAQDKQVKFTRK